MSSPPPGSDCVGRTIDGKFTLLRWLGGTQQSSVFLTELDTNPPRNAAIKLIPADEVDAEERIAQWSAAKDLSHPHLMRVFDAGRCEVDDQPQIYIVTELAEEILSEILRERPLQPAETREMLGPALDALSWLHSRNQIHGHLKPSNIMVVNDRVKLSTDRLQIVGAPARPSRSDIYDAPEAATDPGAPAADVWSLGVVVVEALTQRPPVWDELTTGDPVVPPSVPRPYSGLARECLRVDPARRATLDAVQAHLDPARPAQTVSVKAASPAKTPAPPSRTRAMIVTGTVLVLVIAALFFRSHHAQPSSPDAPPAAPPPAVSQPQPVAPAPGTRQGATLRGAVTYQAVPDVPQNIRDTIQGHIRVRIRLEVDPDGNVADAAIDSPGPSRYFANRAQQAARDWKFRPPKVDGRPVASRWTLEFHFGQSGTTITPTETSS